MPYDAVLRNGLVIDGAGNPWFQADVGIRGGMIAKVGRIARSQADVVLETGGLVVSPGFIDIHTHSDLALLINPRAESKVRQGVTTEVVGNCGSSPAPVGSQTLDLLKDRWGAEAKEVKWNWVSFGQYLSQLETQGTAINVAGLVGHGTVRIAAMGVDNRPPSRAEMEVMKASVARSMEDGAFGLSSGLAYLPGCYANTSELIALCKIVAGFGGFYASHTRGERETIVDALKEAVEIGEKAGVPVQVSHNCPKYGGHGQFEEMTRVYDAARARGVELTIDNDAHTDFNPNLTQVLPPWVQAGGKTEISERLKEKETREQVKRDIVDEKFPGPGYCGLVKHGRWDRIFLFKAPRNKRLLGKSLEEIGKLRGVDPFDAYLDLIVEERCEASAIFNYIDEEDIRALLKHPLMMICSDGAAVAPYGTLGRIYGYYPCCYGEYPYILQRYVREERVLTLPEAIRKMTSFPAQKLGLRDRGLIREGMWADLVVFDPDSIEDRATCRFPYTYPWTNYPHRYPEGIHYVLVNGQVVVRKNRHLGILSGKVLRHNPGEHGRQLID